MEKIRHIRTRMLLGFILLVMLLAVVKVYADSQPPSLTAVLQEGGRVSCQGLNLSVLFISLLGLSLVTLSFAKGIELIKRKPAENSDDSPTFKQEVEVVKAENSRLLHANRELRQDKEDVQSKLFELERALKEHKNNEDILKRSAANLRKEYEKLLDEKEELTLKASASPLKLVKASKSSLKAKNKAKVKIKKPRKKIKAKKARPSAKKRKKK